MSNGDPGVGRTISPDLQRRAHAVLKQRVKLAYAPPQADLIKGAPARDAAADESELEPVTLRTARISRQLSIPGLAKRSGISASTIYRVEHGKTQPRLHVAHAVSGALGLAPRRISEFRKMMAEIGLLH